MGSRSGHRGNGVVSDGHFGPEIASASAAAAEAFAAESRAVAARTRACHALFVECQSEIGWGSFADEGHPDYAVVDPFEVAASELAAATGMHRSRAGALLDSAIDLVERFPRVLAAMKSGRLDHYVARQLLRQMATVEEELRADVEVAVLEWFLGSLAAGERLGRRARMQKVDEIIRTIDREGVRRREAAARKARHVRITPADDGMADLTAHLTAAEATLIADRLDAHSTCADTASGSGGSSDDASGSTGSSGADDASVSTSGPVADSSTAAPSGAGPFCTTPSVRELRADALVALVLGDSPKATGTSVSEPSAEQTVVVRPQITLVATKGSAAPSVWFPRTGRAAIDALLDLLERSSGAGFIRCDPTPGADDAEHRRLDYTPSAAMTRRIRLRDGTCRHPGCSVAADRCDIDHVVPFDHANPAAGGPTVEGNLMCLCRRHHLL